jgi:hypothetical protein
VTYLLANPQLPLAGSTAGWWSIGFPGHPGTNSSR